MMWWWINISTGFRESVKYGRLVVGDLADIHLLEIFFQQESFDGVMHFAANSLVSESMTNPSKQYGQYVELIGCDGSS